MSLQEDVLVPVLCHCDTEVCCIYQPVTRDPEEKLVVASLNQVHRSTSLSVAPGLEANCRMEAILVGRPRWWSWSYQHGHWRLTRHSTAKNAVWRVYGVTKEVRSLRGRRRSEVYMWKTGYVPQYTYSHGVAATGLQSFAYPRTLLIERTS
jgi:hypothetical protein